MQNYVRFLLVALFFPCFANASQIYFSPTTGSASERDLASVRELLKIALESHSGYRLADSDRSADLVIHSQVLQMGDAYILSLRKNDRAGKTLFSDKMKAAKLSDMDTVSSRLLSAVLSERPVAQTANVTNVAVEEGAANVRRIEATRQWLVGIGPGWASNLRSKGGGFTFSFGYLWGLDPDFAVKLSWLLYSGRGDSDDSTYSDFSLGMEYFFTREKTSPFVGASLGYSSAKPHGNCVVSFLGRCDSSRASGWGLNGSAGVKFFRTSSVNLGLVGSYHYLFDKVGGSYPHLFVTQLVVYF